jgi:hypothetical protein
MKELLENRVDGSPILVAMKVIYFTDTTGLGERSQDNRIVLVRCVGMTDENDVHVVVNPIKFVPYGNDDVVLTDWHVNINDGIIYEATPDLFTVATQKGVEIFIDENDNAYVEIEEYNGVFALIGRKRVYNKSGKGYKTENELNGIFAKESGAKKLGDMLVSYGRLNDIEYKDYKVENFVVM